MDIHRVILVGSHDPNHRGLRAQPCDCVRQDHRRDVCSLRHLHPYSSYPNRSEQLCQLLQEQDVEDGGGTQEERANQAVGKREEGDAEDDVV